VGSVLDVVERAGLTGPDQTLPAAVRVKHGQNRHGKTLHYYLNYSTDPQTFDYSYAAGAELLTQNVIQHGQKITLRPWDAAIVKEK
jgi:beta-galactosidase